MEKDFQKLLDKTLKEIAEEGKIPKLLLHRCCAPCSSYVLSYLSDYFDITVYYYNPNISPEEEFEKRFLEQKRLVSEMKFKNKVEVFKEAYDGNEFESEIKGLEKEPEGGARCEKCFRIRLKKAAEFAKSGGYDYFATTLSVSPYKNAGKLNAIGSELSDVLGVSFLFADFKKKEGYKRSIELSKAYGLYRQDYCGCIYSKRLT